VLASIGPAQPRRKHDHFLIGEIFICDRCGCRLGYGRHRSKTGNIYEYFSCLSRVRPSGPCGARYLQVDAVEAAVEAYHGTILYSHEQQEQLREMVREFVSARSTPRANRPTSTGVAWRRSKASRRT